jgi:hypothetical protein
LIIQNLLVPIGLDNRQSAVTFLPTSSVLSLHTHKHNIQILLFFDLPLQQFKLALVGQLLTALVGNTFKVTNSNSNPSDCSVPLLAIQLGRDERKI